MDVARRVNDAARLLLSRPGVPEELWSPHINAPVWPWLAAGWSVAVSFLVMFVLAAWYAR